MHSGCEKKHESIRDLGHRQLDEALRTTTIASTRHTNIDEPGMSYDSNIRSSPTTMSTPTRPILRPPPRLHGSPQRTPSVQSQAMSPRLTRSSAQPPAPRSQRTREGQSNTTLPLLPQNRVANQSPPLLSTAQSPTRPNVDQQAAPNNAIALRLDVFNLPTDWDTEKVYQRFKQYGTLVKIDIRESRGNEAAKTCIVFSPPPRTTDWLTNGIIVADRRVRFSTSQYIHMNRQHSPKDPSRQFAEEVKVSASELNFGVMKSQHGMLLIHSAKSTTPVPWELELNLKRKVIDVNFALISSGASLSTQYTNPRPFKMRLNFPQIRAIHEMRKEETGQRAWIISLDQPPLVFRKADFIEDTHEPKATFWNEWQTWYRQTELSNGHRIDRNTITQLQKEPTCIDIGRWLTYRLIFAKDTVESSAFREMCQALEDHDIEIKPKQVDFEYDNSRFLWSWLDNAMAVRDTLQSSSFSELHQLAEEAIHLPFEVRYQLEVCISHGLLHECNITKDFLGTLAAIEPRRATKLLEKVSDEKERFFSPEDIYRRLLHRVSIVGKPMPTYCALVRAATVTPTTIYFMTPLSETSNRVVRKFQHYQDRFLRVKFTDEKYKGKVQSFADSSMNEVYTRIKRTMANGIRVGDRHYEFLAFGNSQFREHGAWFFASTADLTAQQIRDKLGHFSNINVVAKYCSRIGQCFSTTRATRWSVQTEKIPDINRNGFCFTDGVGKISPFLAQMIAQELGYPSSSKDCPSAFQFRREGCKGILVVDPSLTKHNSIQIRPSQEKFSGTSHQGLEIVRVSQFSTAYLNVQLILVLSALGVDDRVFVRMMQHELRELKEAMDSEGKALELLQKNIDYNHMTIQLASMVLDGFMETNDPFTISCLLLWRAWSVKYLKEKARICVENAAFVLGCVDETATLRGNSNRTESLVKTHQDMDSLPEIFLQIDATGEGKWRVIEGVSILARNPSLHPGDVRVVRAVDVQHLHHIKNCVVFPQTGDRDLGNMCSGGDLDGDDYLVIWDEELIPKEWNHPPMDYTAPPPKRSEGAVTVDDMTSFFVTHMKHDNLGPIAVAHRYWADRLQDGVKDPICLELAQLHSMAVDYAKTGVPAGMPKCLRVQIWPHWSEPKNRPKYISRKVIGQLYDEVQRVPFEPAWRRPFDPRILEAYTLEERTLENAREVKQLYDTAMRRVMAKFSIENEFEVWTTFVLKHSDDMGDYKFAETIGEAANALKDAHQMLCYEKAGTSAIERDWSKMGPFIAAMYTVTATEVTVAMAERNRVQYVGGQWKVLDRPTVENMPFMSFPWLFPTELGRIANRREDRRVSASHMLTRPRIQPAARHLENLLGDINILEGLQDVVLPTQNDQSSERVERRDSPLSTSSSTEMPPSLSSIAMHDLAQSTSFSPVSQAEIFGGDLHQMNVEGVREATDVQINQERSTASTDAPVGGGDMGAGDSDEDESAEVENITLDTLPSALDAFEMFMDS